MKVNFILIFYLYKYEELDYQDAFRIMDIDFDGVISKKDLKQFLVSIISLNEYDI